MSQLTTFRRRPFLAGTGAVSAGAAFPSFADTGVKEIRIGYQKPASMLVLLKRMERSKSVLRRRVSASDGWRFPLGLSRWRG